MIPAHIQLQDKAIAANPPCEFNVFFDSALAKRSRHVAIGYDIDQDTGNKKCAVRSGYFVSRNFPTRSEADAQIKAWQAAIKQSNN